MRNGLTCHCSHTQARLDMLQPRRPLTTAQEARLIRHLDEQLLRLSGDYGSRYSLSSPLQTMEDFLDAVSQLLHR